MTRHSPLGIEGTALSYRDPDAQGRFTSAQVRAKDDNGKWLAKRFAVTSWHRDGSPLLPEEAKEWARQTKRTFIKGEAVATAATFKDFADLLAENLQASGVNDERIALVRAVGREVAAKGMSDMRRDTFAPRLQTWVRDLKAGWSMAPDAPNRRKGQVPLSPASKNKILAVCRQITGLALKKRRLPYDPLIEVPHFREESKLKALFTVDELRRMVSDEARMHAASEQRKIEAALAAYPGRRMSAIYFLAKDRGCHWTSIYNALKWDPVADPWWLACCLLVYTGCRAQEAMALRWEWIRWDARIITLKLSGDYDNKTKTERLIPLEPELADILRPIAKPAGHILPPEIRAGGSGMKSRKTAAEGEGARDYTMALRRYLKRIGLEALDRTAHSLRHCYITLKLAREDMNVERLRKAVGHQAFVTTMGYGKLSQLYESEVDQWPDTTLWLRRPVQRGPQYASANGLGN